MRTETAVVTSRGQLVIPARLRRRLGIQKGTTVSIVEDGGRLIVQPITADFIDSLRGSLKGGPSLLRDLQKDRRRERKL